VIKVFERVRPADAEPCDEGVDARRDKILYRGAGHGLLIVSRLPSRGQHDLNFVRGQPPIAVTYADEAALGHPSSYVEAGPLGWVELRDLSDHHLLALELVDANQGTQRGLYLQGTHRSEVCSDLGRVREAGRREPTVLIQSQDYDSAASVGERRQRFAEGLGEPAVAVLHLDVGDVRAQHAQVSYDLG
jgi:hypothetical protein